MNKLTISDIAEALGVSKTTVSRAISGKGRISPETTRRVREYIDRHNFRPNPTAQALASRKTFNIGLVCPVEYEIFTLPYFHKCLRGITEYAEAKGYDVLISMMDGNDISNLRRLVENHKVDGMILTRTLLNDPAAEYLKQSGMPFVVIGESPDPDLVQVDNDHFHACCELTEVLIAKGCRRLALIGGGENIVISKTRRKGFEEAFAKSGLPVPSRLIFRGISEETGLSSALDSIMRQQADGVVCMDEKLTADVLAECRRRKIRIPDDLKLASFYNSAFLENAVPPVTALDIDDTRLGAVAARTLLEIMDGARPGNQRLKNYQIILRESTS